MTANHDLFNIITVLIIFYNLYTNFEIATASMPQTGNKTIKKI